MHVIHTREHAHMDLAQTLQMILTVRITMCCENHLIGNFLSSWMVHSTFVPRMQHAPSKGLNACTAQNRRWATPGGPHPVGCPGCPLAALRPRTGRRRRTLRSSGPVRFPPARPLQCDAALPEHEGHPRKKRPFFCPAQCANSENLCIFASCGALTCDAGSVQPQNRMRISTFCNCL